MPFTDEQLVVAMFDRDPAIAAIAIRLWNIRHPDAQVDVKDAATTTTDHHRTSLRLGEDDA